MSDPKQSGNPDSFLGGEPETFGPKETEALIVSLYAELREMAAGKVARENGLMTLQPTALVHEAWLRMGRQKFESRAHFFGSAAEAMRRILVERSRRRSRQKRGGGCEHLEYHESGIESPMEDDKLLAVHEVLDRYEEEEPMKAAIVKLRYFAGLTHAEIANLFEVSEKTVRRHWQTARIRLYQLLTDG